MYPIFHLLKFFTMRHLKNISPMAVVVLIAMAFSMLVSCEKEALTETRPAGTSGFNIERAVVELIYGKVPGQKDADIQTRYQSVVNGLTAEQLQELQQAAEQEYRNNLELSAGLQTRSPGASLSPGDMNASFGVDVARSGNTVIVGGGTYGPDGRIYIFENGNLVADFTSDNPYSSGFGFEVAISGTHAAAVGALVDENYNYYGGEVRTYRKQGGSWQLEDVILVDDMYFGPEDLAMDGNRFVVTGRSASNVQDQTVKVYQAQGNNGWALEQSMEYPATFVWDTDMKANTIALNAIINNNFLAPTVVILEYTGGTWTMTSQVTLTAGLISRNVAIGDDAYIVANVGSPAVVFEITKSGGTWGLSGQLSAPGTSFDRAIAAQGDKVAVAGGGFGAPVVYTFDGGALDETYGPDNGSYGRSLYVYGNETGIGKPGAPEGVVILEH